MIYLELLIGFLKVGFFAFGGAYAAIPLISDVVMQAGWLSEETVTYMIAVSESTPGSLMINLATFVGSERAGFLGALVATLAVVFPAFMIILLIMVMFGKVLENKYVRSFIDGLKPCIAGIILATGTVMMVKVLIPGRSFEAGISADWRSMMIAAVIAGMMLIYKKIKNKRLSPVVMILAAAVIGAVVYN